MLPRLLKPDGKVAIWLYANYQQWYRMADIWRRVTTRMPKRWLYGLSHIAVPLYYPGRVPILGRIPGFLLPTSMHPKPEWRVLDTFDWYSPRYQWKHSYEEVWPWFEAHGLTKIRVCGVPVSVQATMPRRPSAPERRHAAPRARALKGT
jgi:hypothetical protein